MRKSLVSIPAEILDTWLPRLKDTEFRILLIVARQTVGRNGKQADWLSHSQLKARTGRASEAVSTALDSLIQKRLILAQSMHGTPLSDPLERRRHRGKIMYRLGTIAFEIQKHGKPKTTETNNKNCHFRLIDPAISTDTSTNQDQINRYKKAIRDRLKQISI